MTNTEIIKGLKAVRTIHNGNYAPFIDAAIKAIEPCGDAISRQAVLEIVEREQNKGDALFGIEQLPPVTPQPKIGRWVDNMNGTFTCDKCGCKHSRSKYCPNCGRKMEVHNND